MFWLAINIEIRTINISREHNYCLATNFVNKYLALETLAIICAVAVIDNDRLLYKKAKSQGDEHGRGSVGNWLDSGVQQKA
jgi:hypothetical protein